jgi:uncharacterized damage-inducible protein DinB
MIDLPGASEAASYYFTYIDQVPAGDVQAYLTSQLHELDAVFTTISEERSLHRYAEGKWSIRQLINHVTDTERAFAFRALWFARGFATALPGYDQEIAARGAEADSIAWAAHVEEFRRVRLSTISLFANMPADAWMRRGVASENEFTVRALLYIVAGHVAHHARILHERYL